MFEKMEWIKHPGKFKEWNFGDDFVDDFAPSRMHAALCEILEKRMDVIFGENGVSPEIEINFSKASAPQLNFYIGDSCGEPLAKAEISLEKILDSFIEDATEYNLKAPAALKRILENALSKLERNILEHNS